MLTTYKYTPWSKHRGLHSLCSLTKQMRTIFAQCVRVLIKGNLVAIKSSFQPCNTTRMFFRFHFVCQITIIAFLYGLEKPFKITPLHGEYFIYIGSIVLSVPLKMRFLYFSLSHSGPRNIGFSR